KKKLLIFILLFSIILSVMTVFSRKNTHQLIINGRNYQIEYALTEAQITKGLSGRTSLCSNCGMLFVFNNEGILPFWMKDTLIPLDIIWIDGSGKIVHYVNATTTNSLETYQNSIPARYVLELNSGDFNKLGLKIGDEILNYHSQL
ncbi:MAG TPA: DUF192 domain-containing protein, partial [Candidatus Woesebacteria bacterium]|nr:DUF192 domain-containing protein [Candidatus Woesebacteria bacterium]